MMGKYNKQRKNITSWDDTYMILAEMVAMLRGKDPSTQVGAFIADSEHRPLAFGYNGTPRGWDDADFPWDSTGEPLECKDMFVVHAERNCIRNAPAGLTGFGGATMYVSLYPCNQCALEIANSGIKRIVYREKRDCLKTQASEMILAHAGVECIQLPPLNIMRLLKMIINWNHADMHAIISGLSGNK